MPPTGSFNVSGLLGGAAGSIDTTSLVNQLMLAKAVPQNQLKDQLTAVSHSLTAYQSINTRLTALQTAAQALTDPTTWTATAASSSSSTVVATSDGSASAGSTTFDVTRLARNQITTVTAAGDGTVVSDPSAGITITGADNQSHQISLASGSATDVAAAINSAGIGVRASVITTDQGSVLQLASAKTGAANAFTAGGFASTPQNLVTAQDATVSVGTPGSGGYTVSSSSNTFTNFIPGVTFSVSAVTAGVTIGVSSDGQSISDKLQALVSAANSATNEITVDSSAGAPLQGKFEVHAITSAIGSAVSAGAAGASLSKYGIDIDKNGVVSFDAAAFATAYAADPAGTKTAISGSFAGSLADTAGAAIAPGSGTITESITQATSQSGRLNDEIDTWTTRLASIQDSLTAKYAAMETALAKLQSQQTYLTSMLTSASPDNSSSSS